MDDEATLRTTVLAPAKLNLMLAVGARRSDGFHEVATVMQTLDLADRLDIDVLALDEDEHDVLVEAPGVPGGDTLVTGAVRQLLRLAKVRARVWITIEKQIPIGAGLGGGSSDAAAALRAVHDLLRLELPPAELHAIAASVGSDVPFFLAGPGRCAFATGRGELIEPVAAPSPQAWVLAFPNVEQSTADVYERYRVSEGAPPLPVDVAGAMRLARARSLRNDLTDAARACCAPLDRLVQAFHDAGGAPLVCGSGATVAVQVRSIQERRAYEAVARAAVAGCWVRFSRTTDGSLDAG